MNMRVNSPGSDLDGETGGCGFGIFIVLVTDIGGSGAGGFGAAGGAGCGGAGGSAATGGAWNIRVNSPGSDPVAGGAETGAGGGAGAGGAEGVGGVTPPC